jgi:hypothetical protein
MANSMSTSPAHATNVGWRLTMPALAMLTELTPESGWIER